MQTINVQNNNGRCLIRFTFQGKRYSLTQGYFDNKPDRARATLIANRIYLDCLTDRFDPTLVKYRVEFLPTVETADFDLAPVQYRVDYVPKPQPQRVVTNLASKLADKLAERFNSADDCLLRLLKAYPKPIVDPNSAKAFIEWLKQGRSPVTVKRYLDILKALDRTLFVDLKIKIPAKPMPKPFTKAEVDAILSTMKADKYYSHYHDFTAFLFSTGVRTSEAIGLQWKHVDLVRGEIDIYESLGRYKGSTSKRERRSTKTNNARVLPCKGRLAEMLSDRKPKDANLEDLVFPSPTGKSIDDHLFSQRCWRKTLEQAKVTYRNPYKTRHTFISHCLEAGIKPITVAYLVGHADTSMIFTKYAGVINKPDLPELF